MDTDDISHNAPSPGELKLIVTTCKAYLNCNINLELIAKKLILDEYIIGKKLVGIIEEGEIKKKSKVRTKKFKTRQRTPRRDFSNQCTVIVRSNLPEKILNLKLFGNGKIVITGGLSKEEGKYGVSLLKQKIRNLKDNYKIHDTITLSDCFENMVAYIKYITKNYLIFFKLFTIFDVNVNLKLDLLLNKKTINNYDSTEICDPVSVGILQCDSNKDMVGFIKVIQIFNICSRYFTNQLFISKLCDVNDPIHILIRDLFDMKEQVLPVTFDMDQFDEDFLVTIENYNTMFDCKFQIDREIFTHILNNKYQRNNLILSAKFEPSNYQGINVKYISRVMCQSSCTSTGKKKSKCKCKEISFLIFQQGNIIVTGGRMWEQLIDGYNVITNILRDEYDNIMVKNICENSSDKCPPIITQISSSGEKIVYVNKNKQIIENPRTVFLLKKLGIFEKYI